MHRLLAASVLGAALLCQACTAEPAALSSDSEEPGTEPAVAPPIAPQPTAPTIYGKWHGETPMASPIGTVTAIIEIVFVPNGNYSALSTSTYPGGTPLYVTGHFTVDATQDQIVVRDVRTDPQFSIDYILYKYSFIDANTIELQDLGCLQWAPQQCGPIQYVRVQ